MKNLYFLRIIEFIAKKSKLENSSLEENRKFLDPNFKKIKKSNKKFTISASKKESFEISFFCNFKESILNPDNFNLLISNLYDLIIKNPGFYLIF